MGVGHTKEPGVGKAELVRLAGPCEEDEGMVIADAGGELVFANERAADILGIVRMGAGVDDYSALHGVFTEDGRPYPSSDLPLARAILHRKTTRNERLLVRRPDGLVQRLDVSARPITNAEKVQVGAVVVIRLL
jgi:PAS domain-containing protein